MTDPEEPPPVQYESGNPVPSEFLKPPAKGTRQDTFVSYPRILGMPSQPGFRLETMGQGWSLVLRRPGQWFLNGLPMALAFGLFVYSQLQLSDRFSEVTASAALHAFAQLLLLRYVSNFALWTVILLYWGLSTRMALRQIDDESGNLVKSGRFWELLALALAGGAVLGFLHMIHVLLPLLLLPFLSLAPGLIVDKSVGVWDAIVDSSRLTGPAFGGAIWVWLLLLLQAVLCFGILGLGLALAAPALVATVAVGYRSFVPRDPQQL